MNDEIIERFANRIDLDPDELRSRWAGKPENIVEDLLRLQDMDTGEVSDLELFNVQKKVLQAYFFGDMDTLNLYKGRRIGYSFIICVCFLIEGMILPESNYAIVSRKKGQAEERIGDIQNLIDNARIEIPQEKDNNDEIVLWNGSTYKAFSGDPDGSRGFDSARAVLMDEMAFIEKQEDADRAFGAFVALGENRKMVQVSTPNAPNDLFMQNHAEGSKSGYVDENGNYVPKSKVRKLDVQDIKDNEQLDDHDITWTGTISIKQPTFYNADEIDVNTSLFEQNLEPVRPDMNLAQIENQRKRDPVGFGQEYLCRPIDDSYKFFSEPSIKRAMERSPSRPAHGHMVMGVDIGIDHDETVITVFEHNKNNVRHMRHFEIVTNEVLRKHGISDPDRGNANHIAHRISQIYKNLDVDHVILDKTGPGETFQRIIERRLGKGVIGFNFSAKDDVKQMMGDLNANLREDNVTLVQNDVLYDHLRSIVREQKDDWQKPKFTGKDYSEDGKDDAAMAAVLGAYPPQFAADKATSAEQKTFEEETFAEGSARTAQTKPREDDVRPSNGAYASASINTRGGAKRSYNARHGR